MGTSISGWIEIGDEQEIDGFWWGFVKAGQLLPRDYNVFAYLFGVRNTFGFEPIAAYRGLPKNISQEVEYEHRKEAPTYSETWIEWWELQSIGWKHEVNESGHQILTTADGCVRLYWNWQLILEMMRMLAERFGDRYVRLVVWFDS
jgi:hypothetical protein